MTTADNVPLCDSKCCAARDRANLKLQREYYKALAVVRELSSNPKEQNERATGRTTRLVLRAVIAISEGHNVLIIAHTLEMALDLKRNIVEHCRDWNIPVEPIGPRVLDKVLSSERTAFRGVTLVDHYVIEQMEAAVQE